MKKVRFFAPIACAVALMLAASQPVKAETIKSSAIPKWFLQDVKVAEQAKFPVSAANYEIEEVFPAPDLPTEWIGGFTGTTQMKSYNQAFSWGNFSMTDFYHELTTQKNAIEGHVHSIFVLEMYKGGLAHWVHAEAALLLYGSSGGGAMLAFANNQVISNEFHSGIDFYTVIPVKGISIP